MHCAQPPVPKRTPRGLAAPSRTSRSSFKRVRQPSFHSSRALSDLLFFKSPGRLPLRLSLSCLHVPAGCVLY